VGRRHVALHIGVRDLEGPVDRCNRNCELPKHDFLIYPESVGSRQQHRGQVASEVENRRFVGAVTHDRMSIDFPIGKFPVGDEEGMK
jgi:hypothetical protein